MEFKELQIILKNRKVQVISAATLLILLLLILSMLSASKQTEKNSMVDNQQPEFQIEPTNTVHADLTPSPTVSPELQKAIDEAKESAKEYDNWQANMRVTYPWLRKFPIVGDKYFVYFEVEKKSFVGRLYPQGNEDIEPIKKDILERVQLMGVDTQSYRIEWKVMPQ